MRPRRGPAGVTPGPSSVTANGPDTPRRAANATFEWSKITCVHKIADVAIDPMSPSVDPFWTGPIRDPRSWLAWLETVFEPRHRFDHVHTVWQRAAELRAIGYRWLDEERANRLELAALLHDVGRAVDPHDTVPHGFAGAQLLDEVGLGDVAPLVAHHSGARHEAAARGVAHLDRWVVGDVDLLAVLTYLDRTTSPSGERVTIAERRRCKVERFGADSRQVREFDVTSDEVEHAERLLSSPTSEAADPADERRRIVGVTH